MGVAGTDAALEAADVALMRDDWREVPDAVRLGRYTFRVIQQNLALGVLYNVVGITLAAVGILPPVVAAAGQSIPDLLIMLSSARLLRGDEASLRVGHGVPRHSKGQKLHHVIARRRFLPTKQSPSRESEIASPSARNDRQVFE